MLQKIRERRKCKSRHTEEEKAKYKQLNNELRRETEKARAEWWERECDEMEELDRSGRSDMVYAKVKKLTRKSGKSGKAVRSTAIKDRNGKLLKEPDKIRERWKEYIEILYDKEGKPEAEEMTMERETSVHEDNKGPELLTSEIVEAIRDNKRNKV